jgi:hypothetical protein
MLRLHKGDKVTPDENFASITETKNPLPIARQRDKGWKTSGKTSVFFYLSTISFSTLLLSAIVCSGPEEYQSFWTKNR